MLNLDFTMIFCKYYNQCAYVYQFYLLKDLFFKSSTTLNIFCVDPRLFFLFDILFLFFKINNSYIQLLKSNKGKISRQI